MSSRGHAVAAGGVAPSRPPRSLVAAGIAVGIVAISTSPILVRVAHVPALALAFWRCLAGALLLAPFALRWARRAGPWAAPDGPTAAPGPATAGRPRPAAVSRRDLALLVLSGACLALHFSLWNASLARTTIASSTVLVACSPLFVGLLSGPLLGEPPSRLGWAGIGLTIAGAAVIATGDAGAVDLGPRALLGDAMAFGGAAAIGGYFLIGRSVRRRLPASAYAASVYGVAAALLLPACLLSGAALGGYPGRSWLAIGGVVAGPQLLGHTVFNALLATLTADTVAVIGLTEPVGATLLAWLIFQELPTAWFWPGAVVVLAGVWLVLRGTANRPVDNPDPPPAER
jgi:drug/metabolite transporter (DMT)-like permease